LAISTPSTIRAVLRRSTDSRDSAIWLRRLTATGFAGLLLDVAYFFVNGLLALGLGNDSLRVALVVNLTLIVPGILFCLRCKIWQVADEFALPAFPREPRSQWAAAARAVGVSTAAGAALAMAFVAFEIVFAVAAGWKIVTGVPVSTSVLITLPAAVATFTVAVCRWAYLVGRNDHLARTRDATPPQLHRAHELHDHTKALEQALHETTALSEELQRSIDGERKLIEELVKEAADARHIADLTNEQVETLTARMNRAQHRSALRERWINIAIAAVSLAAGYILNLVTPDQLGQLLSSH
jgi:hypothetical protein